MKFLNFVIPLLALMALAACNQGPKVITAQNESGDVTFSSGIFDEDQPTEISSVNNSFTDGLHQVRVRQTLEASRYTYLEVDEEGRSYWIATSKQPIDLGATYYYRNPLLKTKFESKEHQRIFDTIYLVTQLVPANHGGNQNQSPDELKSNVSFDQKVDIPTHADLPTQDKGLVKIREIVEDPEKFNGKTVTIKGKCVKINPNIMKRNWIHLQDGSQDDYDLVVTSNTFIKEGQTVVIKAMVTLNKDFGSGYRYDILLENGEVIETAN